MFVFFFFFFKQKTAYEMRISDWSSDVCSSDQDVRLARPRGTGGLGAGGIGAHVGAALLLGPAHAEGDAGLVAERAEVLVVLARQHLRQQPRPALRRSGERPVGTECVRPCRSRWSAVL